MSYFLGVDAGGSNCRARLIAADGTVIGTGQGGTANARIGLEPLYATLRAVSDQAIAEAGLARDQVAAIDQRFLQLRLALELGELGLQKLGVVELAGGG